MDLSNSPHGLLFGPIVRRLEELGHAVLVTARNHAQTLALARENWPAAEVVGGQSPGRPVVKGTISTSCERCAPSRTSTAWCSRGRLRSAPELTRALPDSILPDRAVDARSLMYFADLVVGAGGTMTREAAVMGVPTITMFTGRSAAVDRFLERQGRMARLESVDQVPCIRRRPGLPRTVDELRIEAAPLIDRFVEVLLETASRSRRRTVIPTRTATG